MALQNESKQPVDRLAKARAPREYAKILALDNDRDHQWRFCIFRSKKLNLKEKKKKRERRKELGNRRNENSQMIAKTEWRNTKKIKKKKGGRDEKWTCEIGGNKKGTLEWDWVHVRSGIKKDRKLSCGLRLVVMGSSHSWTFEHSFFSE